MSRSNQFPSRYLSEFILVTYPLFFIPFDSLDSDVIHFTSTWKMVKETTNYILYNTIGWDHTSREIIEDNIS